MNTTQIQAEGRWPLQTTAQRTHFIEKYWQQTPCLFRQALPAEVFPLDANELAGLALEGEIESRLVLEQHLGQPWQVLSGPFSLQQLTDLPEAGWSLLVQGLDQWLPDMADLLNCFRFLPAWRLDDIMASLAPPGGSVGPHYDRYDVFLIQAKGQRSWHLGDYCGPTTARLPGTPLRILPDFHSRESLLLQPGDMLYLPPRLAHHGVAETESITLSVGFRSPVFSEGLGHLLNWQGGLPDHEIWLQDHAHSPDPQCLHPQLLEDFIERLSTLLRGSEAGLQWLGCFLTHPRNEYILPDSVDPAPCEQACWEALLNSGDVVGLRHNEGSRYLLAAPWLFVDGEAFPLPSSDLRCLTQLCRHNELGCADCLALLPEPPSERRRVLDVLYQLVARGSLTCVYQT